MTVAERHLQSMDAGKMGMGTREVGDRVVRCIREAA
jgi:hypothetical protein